MVLVRKLKNHVKAAMAKVVFIRRKTFLLKSQQVWIPATNYV